MSDDRLFHIALASEWEAPQEPGVYDRSTLGSSVDEAGFIHCSRGMEQTLHTVDRFYSQVSEPIVLLLIDESALNVAGLRVLEERVDANDPASEAFPHIYGGPLPTSSVTEVLPLSR